MKRLFVCVKTLRDRSDSGKIVEMVFLGFAVNLASKTAEIKNYEHEKAPIA